ncbi:unnamed protein product [Notodromas monacha]|uniref:Uncharacterized protein n=1 Tax=Notodromas monacha TaxID=399045 RepID=A0A7R9BPN6_9CRUS|nr:unnamed protein product [Notodromas monacha]CAG0918287.1 unnamed protein product [Notodromas monacha]
MFSLEVLLPIQEKPQQMKRRLNLLLTLRLETVRKFETLSVAVADTFGSVPERQQEIADRRSGYRLGRNSLPQFDHPPIRIHTDSGHLHSYESEALTNTQALFTEYMFSNCELFFASFPHFDSRPFGCLLWIRVVLFPWPDSHCLPERSGGKENLALDSSGHFDGDEKLRKFRIYF